MQRSVNKEEYNEEPVFYCTRCLSLAIKCYGYDDNTCYCDKCGCVEISSTDIEKWVRMNERKELRELF